MQQSKKIYTVGQVNGLVKTVLDEQLPGTLTVRGEISGWSRAGSGHCYFSLKEEGSLLDCAMWSSKAKRMKFEPENGMAVLATGHVDVYTARGRYQLYADKLEPEGTGALQLAYEQMVRKLRDEGLFDDKHKKALPRYPQRIGIVTSETGAAVHDITDSIHNRWPCVELYLYPTPVQGDGAARGIATAIGELNRRNRRLKLDLLIVGRGGGSLEDLWAFNEEVVARAIFASEIPIISAVGHEVDTTVADFVADARASTPTKAGVVAVPDMAEAMGLMSQFASRLSSTAAGRVALADERLHRVRASWVFRDPYSIISESAQRVDDLCAGLGDSMTDMVNGARRSLAEYFEQVGALEPHRLMGQKTIEVNELNSRCAAAMGRVLNACELRLGDLAGRSGPAMSKLTSKCEIQLTAGENRLAGLNPKAVLRRGYSITTNSRTGCVVKTLDDVELGDFLATELADQNVIESRATAKNADEGGSP